MAAADQAPYVGPRPFGRDEKDLFFGRDRETRDLCSLVVAHPIVLLYAASGAGKSSLLNAGLIPLLEARGYEVLPSARVSGRITRQDGSLCRTSSGAAAGLANRIALR